MIPRAEAVALINKRLTYFGKSEILGLGDELTRCYHYGKVELKELMDLLYYSPPTCPEEMIR